MYLRRAATEIKPAYLRATLLRWRSFLALSCLIVDHLLWPEALAQDVENACAASCLVGSTPPAPAALLSNEGTLEYNDIFFWVWGVSNVRACDECKRGSWMCVYGVHE